MLKKTNQKGFTIIEVLIVLAIAAVIMLVVFLAVPALQRNSRNSQRTNDASLISSAVGECLGNNNGVQTRCEDVGADELQKYVDTSKLRQLTNVEVASDIAAANSDANDTTAQIVFAAKCDDAGTTAEVGTARQYAVVFAVETTGDASPRCISS